MLAYKFNLKDYLKKYQQLGWYSLIFVLIKEFDCLLRTTLKNINYLVDTF